MTPALVCLTCGARNIDLDPSTPAELYTCGACGERTLRRVDLARAVSAPAAQSETGTRILAGAAVGGGLGAALFGPVGALVGGAVGALAAHVTNTNKKPASGPVG